MKALPSSSDMLEELAAKVEMEINSLAISSFRTALDEMTDFHRFLISAYVAEDRDHNVFSFAQMGFWRALHREWLSEYRNLFERAVAQISREEDTAKDFIKILMNAIFRLLPSKNEKSSSEVTAALFDLHLSLIHRLEDWAVRNQVTEQPENTTDRFQRGSIKNLQKKYEDIIRDFISSSESLLQTIPSLYKWDADEDINVSHANRWNYYRSGWTLLQKHLRNTAYFQVVSVWNEDQIAAPHYCDALIKWFEPLNFKLDEDYIVRHEFLNPDLLNKDWDEALNSIRPYLRHQDWDERPNPAGMCRAVMQNALKDTTVIASGVILGWFLDGKQETKFAAEISLKLIHETFGINSGDGATNIYGFLISLLRILSSGERFRDSGYAGTLDEFIRLFDQMAEREQIPGRVYTPSTRSRRDDLFFPWLVILLSILPEDNTDAETKKLLDFLEHEEFFPDADNSIRRLAHDFKTMKDIIANTDRNIISKGFLAIRPNGNVNTALSNLNKLLDDILSGIEQQREGRIRTRPIDPNRLQDIENAASEKSFDKTAGDFPLYFFNRIDFTNELLTQFTYRHDRHTRGSLTIPLMGQPVANEKSWWSNTIRNGVASVILHDVLRQGTKQEITVTSGAEYWQAIKDFTVENTGQHVLVISGRVDPMWLHEWEWRGYGREITPLPADLRLWKSEHHKDQEGYQFHLNDIAVYQAPIGNNHSYLLSEDIFEKIEFTEFSNGKAIKAEFEDIPDDPWHGMLKLIWARQVTINNKLILRIRYTNPPS